MNAEHERLLDDLTTSGDLTSDWWPAFTAVPRHWFVPDIAYDADDQPVTYEETPEAWMRLAYTDAPIAIQYNDGATRGTGPCTSSVSQPAVVANMLHHLDVEPEMRVLEVGTGSGWNAGLLAAHTGVGNVITVEVDPHLAEQARERLVQAGYPVRVMTGDGALSGPTAAPFDRIIATASCWRVPYAWVAQTRPGGKILTPWGNPYLNGSQLLLTAHADGTATGRVIGTAAFMRLRDQRFFSPRFDRLSDDTVESWVNIDMTELLTRADFAISMRLPDLAVTVDDADGWVMRIATRDGSWARVDPDVGKFHAVQAGPRHLWDEVETAYQWWEKSGRPGAGRFGLTVTPEGQHVWLDTPGTLVA